MKGCVPMESRSYALYEDKRTRFRHQILLQDYEDLQKETEAVRRKLEIMKQKKLVLLAEVRFLRHRYRYLSENPSPKPQPKQNVSQSQKLKVQAPGISKGRNYSRKESILRPSNPKERIFNGIKATLQKPAHMFDLNQNARIFSGKDASFHSSAPMLDLNQKERIHSGKKKSITPFFDLNQISREEEELLGNNEFLRMEEAKRSIQRGVGEEQHEMKLSVCRNVGDGSNRTGKRKISWHDQVALRV